VDVARFTELLLGMPIRVHAATESFALDGALRLARDTGLSVYDASHLELAGRLGLPLAALDAALVRARRRGRGQGAHVHRGRRARGRDAT
jgi:predicted nucleic acid-binding protein